MKKGTSFYLEEDILDEIESYRLDNGLKSKNTALERMILEYKTLKKELEYTKVLADYAKTMMSGGQFIPNTNTPPTTEVESKQPETKKNPMLKRAIRSSYDTIE